MESDNYKVVYPADACELDQNQEFFTVVTNDSSKRMRIHDYDKVYKIKGMGIVIVTSAKTDEEGKALLRLLGMPFRKN